MNLFYLSASGFVNRQRDPSRFRRWLMAHFGREAVRAWVKRNIVDWAPDDPEHRDESHAEARYAEAAAHLRDLGERRCYIGGVNQRYPDDPKAIRQGVTTATTPPAYGRPQHIPEATMARLRADWSRAECVVRASAR